MACAQTRPIDGGVLDMQGRAGRDQSGPAKAGQYGEPASTMLPQMRAEQVGGSVIGPVMTRFKTSVMPEGGSSRCRNARHIGMRRVALLRERDARNQRGVGNLHAGIVARQNHLAAQPHAAELHLPDRQRKPVVADGDRRRGDFDIAAQRDAGVVPFAARPSVSNGAEAISSELSAGI